VDEFTQRRLMRLGAVWRAFEKRIALAGSLGLEAVAELLGSQSGIGKVLEVPAAATDRQGILATLLVLGVAAILPDALAAAVIARFAAWNFAAR
jgi:ABC-type nitrate/sulfonate/bicarbonate transport system permease component